MTEPRDALDAALARLTEDDVMYDRPVSQSGVPMDPVLFVRYDAILAALASEGYRLTDASTWIGDVEYQAGLEDGRHEERAAIRAAVEELPPVIRNDIGADAGDVLRANVVAILAERDAAG
jgi:hypothetical protein